MEFGRYELIKSLNAQGYHPDDLCRALQDADRSLGGPTYLLGPDGLYYWAGCGQCKLMDGDYDLPFDLKIHFKDGVRTKINYGS